MDNLEKNEKRSADILMRDMASHWVKSQAIVSAFITSNVIDIHHAEDLIQETAKAVAEKFSGYDNSRPFTPWVMAIARNQILKYYRKQSRDRHVLSEAALDSIASAFERNEEDSEDRRRALRECLSRIKGKSREALQMRYGEGKGLKDIGNIFGVTPSTVSVMLFRVRETLEKCINSYLAQGAH